MPTIEEITRTRIVLPVPKAGGARVRRERSYREVEGASLTMDLYAPHEAARPAPVVFLVHGGPIPERARPKDWGIFVSTGELLAASGFAAVAFNHRFHAAERLGGASADVSAVVRHVRENARELGIDAERVALWVYSGGGPFLAPWLRERPGYLRAVAAYYAVLDLRVPPPGVPDSLSTGTRGAFSPAAALAVGEARVPPVLVARAGLDGDWINDSIRRFVDVERSREILRHTLTFLGRHLRGGQ
jgi:acetyl esterase/lipase